MKNFLFIVLLSVAIVGKLAAQCDNVNCSGTTASGTNASAIGTNTTASGHSSFASGNLANAQGNFSTAIGTGVTANADGSVSIGQFVLSAGSYSLAIGRGISNDLRLTNGIPNSLLIGFKSDKPTFFVSETPSGYQSGKVGIGNVTAPEAKLHIRADAGEDADLMLQATGPDKKAMLLFNGGPGIIANLDREAPLLFSAGGRDNTVAIRDGMVGIGTENPQALLDINGQLRISGGNPGAGRVLTSDANGNASWQTPSGGGSNWTVNGSHIYRTSGNVGIGTTSPGSTLHVRRAVSGGYSYVHRIEVTGTAANVNNTKALEIRANSMSDAFLVYGDGRIITKGEFLHFDRTGNSSIRANDALSFRTNNVERIWITQDGQVGIGTTNPLKQFHVAGQSQFNGDMWVASANVYVEGEIHAKKFRATYNPWPDYVFDPDYELPGLSEIEHFVTTNRHLPGLPSAAEVETEGFELAEMNGLLLKKIEELTLYLIDQQKEINALKEKMSRIETQ